MAVSAPLAPSPARSTAAPDPVAHLLSRRLEDFPRTRRLRRQILDARPAIAVRRSQLLAEHLRREPPDGQPAVLWRARALEHILGGLELRVFDDELLVGSTTEHRVGCAIYPELHGGAIWPELASISRRAAQPVQVSDEALEVLGLEVLPLFCERNIHDWAKRRGGDDGALALMERWIYFLVSLPNGVSHVLPDYATVVRRGLGAIADEARQRGEASDDGEQATFYQAVEVATRSVIGLAQRYAERCETLAARSREPRRQRELERAAAALRHVPAAPARTFFEALQAVWITHVALLQENSDLAINLGRMDQYCGALLDEDLRRGRLTLDEALELAMALYLKLNDHSALIPTGGRALFGGGATDPSITLSGVTADGGDATNLCSYVLLEAIDLLRLREPNIDARFHAGSPDEWYRRVLEVVGRTGATPALYNDAAIIPSLRAKGVSEADARDYAVIGCVEPAAPGRTYGSTGSILLNLAEALELALHDGSHPASASQIGPQTGSLPEHQSFASFWSAFCRQLEFLVEKSVAAEHCYERAHEALLPVPLMSALIEGALERGRDVTRGSARYDVSGVWVAGLADVVDSLSALQALVFEERRVSAHALMRALLDNFDGHARARALCTRRAPKYGNDDDAADAMAVRVVEAVDAAYRRHRNYRGGPYQVGYWSMTVHAGFGDLVGALPSGRRRGEPLASGATPVSGVARRGPSAALCSTAKLPAARLTNGIANNHKVAASLLDDPSKRRALEQLVRGFFAKGGMQLQLNVIDRATLLAALSDPALAKELLVRVSGYTAYFGDLDAQMQREIVDRTEDSL